VLKNFAGDDGASPFAGLVLAGTTLYGTTFYGGALGKGVIFSLDGVIPTNRPPVAQCRDVTVSAGANCAADASVDSGSFDPDSGDMTTLRQEPPGPYPLGTNQVMLIVTDNHGASDSCTAIVTVLDTTPPTISEVAVTPNVLWPPNGKLVEVTLDYTAADDCGSVTNVLTVTSNEAPKGADWVIEDNHHVQLRAERSDTGSGRVYTLTVISTDNAGNSSTKTTTVTAPKNRGKVSASLW
jgi:uncharacterized repeat protein (TIGR03803 family)